jgi:hypothetical protein
MRNLVLASIVAALLVACRGGSGNPTSTPPAESTPAASATGTQTQTLSEHEPELRTAYVDFEKQILAGKALNAYSYASDEFKQKCSLLDFTTIIGFVKTLLGDVKDTDVNVEITDIRYEPGKAFVTAKTSISGGDFSSDANDDEGYWVWENASWKIASDQAQPCEGLGTSASTTSTPAPTGPGSSRSNAVPLGSPVRTGDLEVTVLTADLDADATTFGDSSFATPARSGFRYVVVRVHVRNAGTGEDTIDASEGDFGMTGSANVLYEPYDDKSSCGFLTRDRLEAKLFPGGSADGNVCFQIPADERDVLLVVSPFISFKGSDRRYLALQ